MAQNSAETVAHHELKEFSEAAKELLSKKYRAQTQAEASSALIWHLAGLPGLMRIAPWVHAAIAGSNRAPEQVAMYQRFFDLRLAAFAAAKTVLRSVVAQSVMDGLVTNAGTFALEQLRYLRQLVGEQSHRYQLYIVPDQKVEEHITIPKDRVGSTVESNILFFDSLTSSSAALVGAYSSYKFGADARLDHEDWWPAGESGCQDMFERQAPLWRTLQPESYDPDPTLQILATYESNIS